MKTNIDQLKKLIDKSAIIARGMVEYYDSEADDHAKLRSCQEAALEYSKEIGADIEGTSLTSKIGKMLRDAGVFKQFSGKPKRGEGYVLEVGPHYDEFIEFLEDNQDYGTALRGQATMSQIAVRTKLLDHMDTNGSYRINGKTHPTDSATYKFLRQMLNEGKLDVIFVKAGAVAAVKHKKQTLKVGYWDE